MILFLVLFASASLPAAESLKRGGTLRLAIDEDPASLDPANLPSTHAAALSFLVFNSLVDYQPDGTVVPVLAESLPTISPDGLTYTFSLRRGVRFSDGREFTSDDVVFTLERSCDPTVIAMSVGFFRNVVGSLAFGEARAKEAATPEAERADRRGRWIQPTAVAGLRALDRFTFQLRLETPDLTVLPYMGPMGIVPREEFTRGGRSPRTHPIGTGSFVLKEWARGVRMRFERNSRSFRADQTYLDAVEVQMGVDQTTQAMLIDRGEIDFQFYLPDPDFLRWKKNPRLQPRLESFKGTTPMFITLNCELPPFTNRLVRQALNHAVNKQAVVRKMLNRAAPARGPLPMNAKGFNPSLPEYGYDPAKARALLAEAGYPNGFETTLWTLRTSAAFMKVAQSVQEDLRLVGVTAHLKEVSWPALTDSMTRRKTVPMGLINAAPSDEPKDTLDFLLNGDNITEEGCGNNAFYSNAQIQELFRAAARETDEIRRIRRYQRIEELIVQDAPGIFLCHGDADLVRQPWLKGGRYLSIWPSVRLENGWIKK